MSKVFIIGAGATASIIKLFFPGAKSIAPGGKEFLPIQYIWDTEYTRKFLSQFNIQFQEKILKVSNCMTPEEIEAYNKLTRKPMDNSPSTGKKEIKAFQCKLPTFPPDIQERVVELTDNTIITEQGEYEYDLVFICSPLTFKPFNKEYYPITIYKCDVKDNKFEWDYAYLGGRLLQKGIYRASNSDEGFFLEQTGTQQYVFFEIEDAIRDELKVSMKIITCFPNRFAHFNPDKKNEDTDKVVYASRLSTLDQEFLLSNLIEKIFKRCNDGI